MMKKITLNDSMVGSKTPSLNHLRTYLAHKATIDVPKKDMY